MYPVMEIAQNFELICNVTMFTLLKWTLEARAGINIKYIILLFDRKMALLCWYHDVPP